MKKRRKKSCVVHLGRWMSYAAAGAVTALAANNDAEAAILYSGVLNANVAAPTPPVHTKTNGAIGTTHQSFKMKQLISNSHPGTAVIGTFRHVQYTASNFVNHTFQHFQGKGGLHLATAAGGVVGPAGAIGGYINVASKLATGAHIGAAQGFVANNVNSVYLLNGGYFEVIKRYNLNTVYSQWGPHGTQTNGGAGYLGFKFKIGSDVHYGWARIQMLPGAYYIYPGDEADFRLVSYAYDTVPGETINAGQMPAAAPEPASLGLLALGGLGVLAMRRGRMRKAAAQD